MKIEGETLNKVQKLEVEILTEVTRICEENHIEYYLMFGTLLGVIRHGGFIPWDDDIDIVMSRKNYLKFQQVFPNCCKEQFYLQHKFNEKFYSCHFAKVRMKNTIFGSETDKKLNNMGVWVDIFCADEVPDKKLNKAKKFFSCQSRFTAFYANKLLPLKNRKLLWLILTCLFPIKIVKLVDSFFVKCHDQDLYSMNNDFDFVYVEGQMYPKMAIYPLKEINMFNIKTYIPNDAKTVLKIKYGDWEKMPPLEKRVSEHDIKYIELDNY